MAKAKDVGVDFTIFDNGQAVATADPTDAAGLDTTLPAGIIPTWASDNPSVLVSPASDGLSAIVSPAVPPVLVTGAHVTVSATLADGTVITGTSDPIDIVAGGPAGFKVVLK